MPLFKTQKQSSNKSLLQFPGKGPSLSTVIPTNFSYKKQKNHNKEVPFRILEQGSITVEASVVLPVIFFLLAFILFFLRIITLQVGVQRVLDQTSEEISVACAYHDVTEAELILLCEARLLSEIDDTSLIRGDGFGFSYLSTDVTSDNYVNLVVEYTVEFPFKIFGSLDFHQHQMAICRKWVGFDASELSDGEEYVYVTEYGEVYHKMRSCTYLNPSIVAVDIDEVSLYRNESRKKYTQCASCKSKNPDATTVYITDYGTTYHTSLSCSGLRRTIYKKRLSEVIGLGACPKCGG